MTGESCIQCASAGDLCTIPDDSIDYIFTDPPFGYNINYSELNFLWESWLKCFTNTGSEAIISKAQNKQLVDYQTLMQKGFEEFFRILKPNRWMTVEFHNSQNSVWNAIQEALNRAGFIVADVRTIDKKQASFNQVKAQHRLLSGIWSFRFISRKIASEKNLFSKPEARRAHGSSFGSTWRRFLW